MIPELAHFSLIIAMVVALFGTMAPLVAKGLPNIIWPRPQVSLFVIPTCIVLSFITLMGLFVQADFSVQYIAHNASLDLPFMYKLTAVWGAHEGSLLLWLVILAVFGAASILISVPKSLYHAIVPWYCFICLGFVVLIIATSNPFLRYLPMVPTDGGDLNPLLQDPGFVIHPPVLYIGYVGFAVPFMFALCANAFQKQGIHWGDVARPWSIIAFAFLTLGIALGSWWAYYELGWGGWWFWDPVENASFMPWLSACALNHVFMLNKKTNKYNGLALFLAILTFVLCLMGTFLVRSGALTSVHSFAADPTRGMAILGFITLVIALATIQYCRITSTTLHAKPFKQDAGTMLGVILLLCACFTVFLGTLYPLIYEALTNQGISIGVPYYQKTFTPIAFVFIWAYVFTHSVTKPFKMLLLGTLVLGGGVLLYTVANSWFYAILTGSAIAVMVAAVIDFAKCANAKRLPVFLIHFGFAVSLLGIVLTSALSKEYENNIRIDQTISLQNFSIQFKQVKEVRGPNYQALRGVFLLKNNNQSYILSPEKRFYPKTDMVMSETAIKAGLMQDIYITLADQISDNEYAVRIHVKPFVRWIWLGAIIIATGCLLRGTRLLNMRKH